MFKRCFSRRFLPKCLKNFLRKSVVRVSVGGKGPKGGEMTQGFMMYFGIDLGVSKNIGTLKTDGL